MAMPTSATETEARRPREEIVIMGFGSFEQSRRGAGDVARNLTFWN
jgi:hypothetical protein